MVDMTRMPIMRTADGIVRMAKENDPNTAITAWFIRKLVREGKIRAFYTGKKLLVSWDSLVEYLNSELEEEPTKASDYGVLRRAGE